MLRLDLKLVAPLDRLEHRRLPAGQVFGEHDRQLDHVLGLQLLRRHRHQHVGALGDRRGRQFEHARGPHARQRLERKIGARVVRLIDNHDGVLQGQPIDQRGLHPADISLGQKRMPRHIRRGHRLQALQAVRRLRLEMRLERLAHRIHIALAGLGDPETLDGGHDHHCGTPPLRRRNLRHFRKIAHRQARAIHRLQRLAIRMARCLERIERLAGDGLRRRQPQGHRRVHPHRTGAAEPMGGNAVNRMRRQQRLAAAGGQAQTHAWRLAEIALVHQAALPGFRGHLLKGGFGADLLRTAQKFGETFEGAFLVTLERHARRGFDRRWMVAGRRGAVLVKNPDRIAIRHARRVLAAHAAAEVVLGTHVVVFSRAHSPSLLRVSPDAR